MKQPERSLCSVLIVLTVLSGGSLFAQRSATDRIQNEAEELWRAGEWQKSWHYYEFLHKKFPDREIYGYRLAVSLLLGLVPEKKGEERLRILHETRVLLEDSLARIPPGSGLERERSRRLFFLGLTHQWKGEFSVALQLYSEGLDLDPDFTECLYQKTILEDLAVLKADR